MTLRCVLGKSTVVPDVAIDGAEDFSLGQANLHKGTPSRVGTVPAPSHIQAEAEQASPLLSVLVGIGAGIAGWYAYNRWIK